MQIDGETVETVADFILGGSKINAAGVCTHEITRTVAHQAPLSMEFSRQEYWSK